MGKWYYRSKRVLYHFQVTLYTDPKDEKIYPCYFYPELKESVTDKCKLNTHHINTVKEYAEEFMEITEKLRNNWYKLKYAVQYFHATYKLLYSVLDIYCGERNTKIFYHNLVMGPRKISENCEILKILCPFIIGQCEQIAVLLKNTMRVKFQDLMTKLFSRINRAMERLSMICLYASDHYDTKMVPYSYINLCQK